MKSQISAPIGTIGALVILLPLIYLIFANIIPGFIDSIVYSSIENKIDSVARAINRTYSGTTNTATVNARNTTVMFQFSGPVGCFNDFRQLYREDILMDLVDCEDKYCICTATLAIGKDLPDDWKPLEESDSILHHLAITGNPKSFFEGVYNDFFADLERASKIKCKEIENYILDSEGIAFVYMHANASYTKVLEFRLQGGMVSMGVLG